MVTHDGERHGKPVNVPLKEHCLAISFDGNSYFLHAIYKPTGKDITEPVKLPVFNDYDRRDNGRYSINAFKYFDYMMRTITKAENVKTDSEEWNMSASQYIDNSNDIPEYAEDRNVNAYDYNYAASDYVNNRKHNGENNWEQLHPSISKQHNRSYRF